MQQLTIFFLLLGFKVSAQTRLTGILLDSVDSQPLMSANVVLTSLRDSAKQYLAVSQTDGSFVFENIAKGRYLMKISYIGYRDKMQRFHADEPVMDIGILKISPDTKLLNEVKIEAKLPIAEQKGDTVQLNADAFKVNPDATVEDLVKKMPGISVENGTLKAQGENVQRVLIDGKEFFGDDANMTLRNLSADMVDKVQIFDQYSDQSRFTGFYDGNTTKTLNIVTKRGVQSGQFGKLYAGYGSDQRYHAGGNVNLFKGKRRVSVFLLSNNINQQNFSQQDLTNISQGSGGGSRARTMVLLGGMQGVSGRGGQSNTQNFLTSPLGGITATQSVGVNYTDSLTTKTQLTISYFYNYAENTNQQELTRSYFLSDTTTQFYTQNSIARQYHQNHRFNGRIEHKFDSSHSVLLTPRLSFQQTNYDEGLNSLMLLNNNILQSRQQNTSSSSAHAYNFQNDLLYRYAFPKKGRTLSANINTQLNDRNGKAFLNARNDFLRRTDIITDTVVQQTLPNQSSGYALGSTLSYTEPLRYNKSQVMVEHQYSYAFSEADRQVKRLQPTSLQAIKLDSSLSNVFNSTYQVNKLSTYYRHNSKKGMANIGLGYQEAKLNGNQQFPASGQVSRTFYNLLPSAFIRLDFDESRSARIIYRTSTNAPTIQQLQNVIDNTNPLLLRVGNPDLVQEYTHFGLLRYSINNIEKASSTFAMVAFTHTENYIGSASSVVLSDSVSINGVVLRQGTQITQFKNIGAQSSVRGYFSYGIPVSKIKSTINTNSGISFARTPSSINDRIGFTYNTNISQGLTVASNISEKIDFTVGYTAQYNFVQNTLQPSFNNNYFYHTANLSGNWLTWKGFLLQTQATFTGFAGLSDAFNRYFTLWNIAIGKKILPKQKGEIKLTIFDVLNSNNSIARSVTETYVEDNRTVVLRQYFMLSFTYNFRKFE